MSRRRFITLLIAAVLAISGALYLSTQRNLPRDARGGALLPGLAGEIDTVTSLTVRRGSATPTVTLHSHDGRWTVAERADYPADVAKLRKLLLALSDAKLVEEKTSNPASFPIIGVEDPSLPKAGGAEISFLAKDGKHAVIVGKPIGQGNFVRRGGENTSYTIEPGITFEAEPRYWIEARLLDIPAAKVQSVAIKPATGSAYSVHRAPAAGAAGSGASPTPAAAAADGFSLEGTPPGRKAADTAALAPSPSAFSGLTVDDVAPVAGIDFSKAIVATVTLTDGEVFTITGASSGDKHWIQVQAGKDAALNAKAAGRAFEIAAYRFDAVFRPLEQLLVPKEPPPGAKKPPALTGPAGPKPMASPVPSTKKAPPPTPRS
ncbi:MAG: DUF4340 domain-containing protein [Gammaproteobacteria bacterium]